jgi:hypothetical protein
MKKPKQFKQASKATRPTASSAKLPRARSTTPKADLDVIFPMARMQEIITSEDGITPVPRGKRLYAFYLGDPQEQGVAAVLRVYADSKQEALTRSRVLANLYFGGTDLIRGTGLYDNNKWLDSFRIYFDGDCICLDDGMEETELTMRPTD